MNSNFIVKLALTTAFISIPTMGCSTIGVTSNLSESKSDVSSKKAHGWARKAEKEFAKGRLEKAVTYAEMSVEGDMTNRQYREQLGRIYLASGRFKSAERTLQDVVELGQVDSRTIISLALAKIAQGKVDGAMAVVDDNQSTIPASDYGLILALAGQTGRGVDVLKNAIRSNHASARTRQNLALAYALDGRWREARIMAVQDMPQDLVNSRIAEWAQYARPGAYELRVAGLLKVSPRADSGQPVRLALSNITEKLAQVDAGNQAVEDLMSGENVADAVMEDKAPEEVATVMPVVEPEVKVAAIVPVAPVAPLISAPTEPVKTAPVTSVEPVRQTAQTAPVVKKAADVPMLKKLALADVKPRPGSSNNAGGSHIVQLGAYSNAANANRAWDVMRNRYSVLSGFSSAKSTVNVGGRTLTRVAAAGFGNKAAADAVCNSIKASGGDCIVRTAPKDSSVQLADANSRVVAVR